MTNEEILLLYKGLVPFLSKILGPSCEVVLHDVRNEANSIIAIANGNLSGREVGGPLTDLAKQIIVSGVYNNLDSYINYNGSSKGKDFLSSTYFIKNGNEIIGLLCINKDISALENAEYALKKLAREYNLDLRNSVIKETLEVPVNQMLSSMIQAEIDSVGIPVSRMKKADRIIVVQNLKKQGVLDMKGAVEVLARALDVSVPTIYRDANAGE